MMSFNAFSQRSHGGEPLSFTNKNISSEIDHIRLSAPNMDLVMQEVDLFEKNGQIYKIAELIPANITMDNSGTWDILEDGTKIWRIKISVKEAKGLALYYEDFYLPEHSQLFLYNENRKQVIGSFDHRNNPTLFSDFSTEIIQGEDVYLEYIQSSLATEDANISIFEISYIFRGIIQLVGRYEDEKPPGGVGSSQGCEVNINCPEGDNWQTQKRGVAEYFTGVGLCSGTVVNNTSNDGTPYFLSADHCGGSGTDFSGWQFYFNYEAAGCTDPGSEPAYNTVTGAIRRARGDQNTGTDFLLFELNCTETDLETYGAYYNGWYRGEDASPNGVCIHHPAGDIKKISTYTDPAVDGTFNSCPPNEHWLVQWVATVSDWGVTEGGSSGSPLFNNNKLVIGTESGGASACGVPVSSANDLYGKFDYHWESNGGTDADQLKPWLDPTNSGDMTCLGREPGGAAGTAPTADFSGTPTTVVEGGTVDFTDLSTENPTSWDWIFAGGTPGVSTDQNPSIVYNTAGNYDVTLTVTNADGTDPETKALYIEVVAAGTLSADFTATPTSLTEGGTVDFTDTSLGTPTTWDWVFEGGTPGTSTDQDPADISYPTAGVYSVTLTIGDGADTSEEIKTGYITVTDGTGSLMASFVASAYTITAGECINFNDQTSGTPTSWSWSFPGATPASSTSQHPNTICYNTAGIYDVVLQASNSSEQDTYICEDCITVLPDPSVPIANFEGNVLTVPVGGVVQFTNLSENGPFDQWSWVFEGAVPTEFADSAPPPIAYMEVGCYDVELRCRKTNGVQDIEVKENYICVIPQATVPPVANFTANYTVIQPGDEINFIDLSTGDPYNWTWSFTGADVGFETSTLQNPTGIPYSTEGVYPVTLTVSNNFGEDIMTREEYIVVSEEDPCTEAPIADFEALPRLIAAEEYVQFHDLSTGLPSYHTWSFSGGLPLDSNEGSPTDGIQFNTEGIYDVTLTVINACGSDFITKENYIYVFNSSVQSYCDTISTVNAGETVETWIPTGTWGFLAGNNGNSAKGYANYFNDYTFSEIRGVIIPVTYAMYGDYANSVTFYIWNAIDGVPADTLGSKKVYIRDMTANQTNVVLFDPPIQIEGPFFAGFGQRNRDEDNDGVNDDLFVVPIVTSRGVNPNTNDMFIYQSSEWHTTNDLYNFSSALPIKPMTCLIDIEQQILEANISIYPNPSTGFVTIQVSDQSVDNFEIEVYDALGRRFTKEPIYNGSSEYTIDLSSNPEGMYIIRINTGDHIINKKLILSK